MAKATAQTTADFTSVLPIDPGALASRFGASVSIMGGGRRSDQLGAHGELTVKDGRWHIRVPRELQKVRQRFSIAHEIGHILLFTAVAKDPRLIRELRSEVLYPTVERLCDAGAAQLLMPTTVFADAVANFGRPARAMVEDLAARFNVSLEAAARRVTEVLAEWSVMFWEMSTTHPRGAAWRTSKQQQQRPGAPFLPSGLSSSRLTPDIVEEAAASGDASAVNVVASLPGVDRMVNASAWYVPRGRQELVGVDDRWIPRQSERVFLFFQDPQRHA